MEYNFYGESVYLEPPFEDALKHEFEARKITEDSEEAEALIIATGRAMELRKDEMSLEPLDRIELCGSVEEFAQTIVESFFEVLEVVGADKLETYMLCEANIFDLLLLIEDPFMFAQECNVFYISEISD